MASFRKRSGIWYIRYVNVDGKQVERRGHRDYLKTKAIARKLESEISDVRSGTLGKKEFKLRSHAARPLADHLHDWHRDMLARMKTSGHADQYCERAGKVIAVATGTLIADLETGRRLEAREKAAKLLESALSKAQFDDLSSEDIQAALATLHEHGKSKQTVNHYRAAIRAFLRWMYDKKRARDIPMQGVTSLNVEDEDARRSLSDEELGRLIQTAQSGPVRFNMPGPLRAMAYRVAALTGFRVSELRTLTPESFHLDSPQPSVFLKASSTKNRKPADQPISQTLARELRDWLRDKPRGQSVFPLHHETAKAIKADLEVCGIPYVTDEGVADFHSLRAYFVSALIRSRATVKEVQRLARHARPETTLKHYAKVAPHNLHAAIEALPDPVSTLPHAKQSSRPERKRVV